MAKVTAQQYAERWAQGLKQNTNRVREGIARVTEAPGAKAARQKDKMLSKLTASVQDGTWGSRVASVSLEDWKRAATDKGVNRIAQGVDEAQPRQVVMAERLLAAVDATKAEVDRLPSNTLEDSIARSTAWIRGMAARKLRRPGR